MTQRFLNAAKYVMQQINPANLSGAIDVVIVEQEDGSLLCSPFHVRFGKLGTLVAEGRPVDVYINGDLVPDLRMKLGRAGEAFFVAEGQGLVDEVLTSPITSDIEEEEEEEEVEWRRSHPEFSSKKRRRSAHYRSKVDEEPQLDIRCFSDDEICSLDETQETGETLTWQWGELPVEERVGRRKRRTNRRNTVPAVSTSDVPNFFVGESQEESDDGENPEMSPEVQKPEESPDEGENTEKVPEDEGEKPEKVSDEGEKPEDGADSTGPIYLSEVIERPELRDRYVYRYGATSPVDQGYRSDGEGTGNPPSPIRLEDELSTRLFPVHLSLCGEDHDKFKDHMVLYQEFCDDPESILANPDLVVQFNDGRHYSWPVAAPLFMASLVYQSDLPPRVVEKMVQKQEAKRESKRRGSYFSRLTGWRLSRPALQPTPPATEEPQVPDKSASKDDEAPLQSESAPPLLHVKSLRLSSEQLKKLKLRPGANSIEYRVTSQFQGTARCQARIFLWQWHDKVVVSDIDGTITQSDVMGQLGPFLGRDVSQRGVASLYSNIASNRYRVLYLSSRAIGQAHWTRSYLDSVVQRGTKLPEGPVLLSPTSLLFALVREIRNRPEDFKIPCLKDVRSLFPENSQPFYAGFGNKVNDVRSYQAVGIDPERIFVVDTSGALRKHSHVAYKTSYSNLGELVHHFFPEQEEEKEFSNFVFWRTPVEEVH